MIATWGPAIMIALALGGLVWRDGRRDGRLDALLERLTERIEDHEDRVRDLEDAGRRPRRQARQVH